MSKKAVSFGGTPARKQSRRQPVRPGVERVWLPTLDTFLLAAGLAIGLGVAVSVGKTAASLIYGLQPSDPLTLGSAVVLLAIVALFASYGPAWRASRLQPMDALREE